MYLNTVKQKYQFVDKVVRFNRPISLLIVTIFILRDLFNNIVGLVSDWKLPRLVTLRKFI